MEGLNCHKVSVEGTANVFYKNYNLLNYDQKKNVLGRASACPTLQKVV